MPETGTTSYLDRARLTKRIDDLIQPLLLELGFLVQPFGQTEILHHSGSFQAFMRKLESKYSEEILMVKFSPDFLVLKPDDKNILFAMDTKVSITPVFFGAQIEKIRIHSKKPDLIREDIGDVEREAWFVYNTYYPPKHVAVFFATPYNPNLILAEWVSNIRCLYCFNITVGAPVNCKKCPVFGSGKGIFGVVQNLEAGGSFTPHTNIDFSTMRSLAKFIEDEFDIVVPRNLYNAILDEIKTWTLNKPRGRVNWTQFNNVVKNLHKSCPWLRGRRPDRFGKMIEIDFGEELHLKFKDS